MKHLFILVFVLLCLTPVMAQEATEPAALATVEAAPITIINEDGATLTIEDQTGTQDTEPSQSTGNDPLAYVIIVVLAVLLVAAMIFGARFIPVLSKMVPPETAASIYQSGLRMGLQLGLNQSATTPTPLDDEFFQGLAQSRGYEVVKHADGHYEVKLPSASLSAANMTFTSTATTDIAGRESRPMPPPETPLTQG